MIFAWTPSAPEALIIATTITAIPTIVALRRSWKTDKETAVAGLDTTEGVSSGQVVRTMLGIVERYSAELEAVGKQVEGLTSLADQQTQEIQSLTLKLGEAMEVIQNLREQLAVYLERNGVDNQGEGKER